LARNPSAKSHFNRATSSLAREAYRKETAHKVAGRRVKGSYRVTCRGYPKWPIVRLLALLSNGALTNFAWHFFGTEMPRKITAKNRRNHWRAAAKKFSRALCSSRGKNVWFADHDFARR
jgi:hypothetical protein